MLVNSPPAKFVRDDRGHLGVVIDSIVSLGSILCGTHVERSVLDLPAIWINGGRRGYLVGIAPQVLIDLLQAQVVDCALEN
jgi:hypothetical protein